MGQISKKQTWAIALRTESPDGVTEDQITNLLPACFGATCEAQVLKVEEILDDLERHPAPAAATTPADKPKTEEAGG